MIILSGHLLKTGSNKGNVACGRTVGGKGKLITGGWREAQKLMTCKTCKRITLKTTYFRWER